MTRLDTANEMAATVLIGLLLPSTALLHDADDFSISQGSG